MTINFKNLKKDLNIKSEFEIDFSETHVEDALLKKVKKVNGIVSSYLVDETDIHITVDCDYNVDYLDAVTLEKLDVEFSFSDEILFTSDVQKAEEFDLELFEEEIELERFIWELIIINTPFNYSKSSSPLVIKESEMNQNQPFANIFNK